MPIGAFWLADRSAPPEHRKTARSYVLGEARKRFPPQKRAPGQFALEVRFEREGCRILNGWVGRYDGGRGLASDQLVELLVMLGQNATGKSTKIKILAGKDTPEDESV